MALFASPRFTPRQLLGCGGFLLVAWLAQAAELPAPRDDFSPLVKLAPFVVQGKQLSVSIHARSGRDRRYGQDFAEEVVKVVYESVTPETGKGLLIIGAKGEPHPTVLFRKFLALDDAGKLDPAVAARGPELSGMLDHWRHAVDEDQKADAKSDDAVDPEFEKIVTALPLPLEGIGARLYQLAWAEKFDDARVEARLRGLHAADLDRDLFAHFDWVFYLPPKGAFDHVLDELIADALKDEHAGFFERTVAKGAILVVKPKIRHAIEGVRQGLLFQTIVEARAGLAEQQVSTLTEAYINALIGDRSGQGSERERAVRAVRDRLHAPLASARREAN